MSLRERRWKRCGSAVESRAMTIGELKKIIAKLPDEMEVVGSDGPWSESEVFVKIVSRAELKDVDDKTALFLELDDAPDEEEDLAE